MYFVFNKTCTGYSHLKAKKKCQDYSSSYQDNERIIITCCDGHGGAQYVRSDIGSKLASDAILTVFKNIDKSFALGKNNLDLQEKIKLLVLCEYNRLVEKEIAHKPIRKAELEGLNEDQIDTLRFNPAKAYGTTLSGVLLYKNTLFVVSIGDTEVIGVRKGEMVKIFDNSNDPAGNVTYSMCQEDAYNYLRVAIVNAHELDGILLCTDGLSSPFQTYENFFKSFIKPTIRHVINSKSLLFVENEVKSIASELGVGDDVSLAFLINNQTNIKYYRSGGNL